MFEWNRYWKTEEHYERQISDDVYDRVLEYYGVDEVSELTEEQIREIEEFRESINPFSVLQAGFSNLLGIWESENVV